MDSIASRSSLRRCSRLSSSACSAAILDVSIRCSSLCFSSKPAARSVSCLTLESFSSCIRTRASAFATSSTVSLALRSRVLASSLLSRDSRSLVAASSICRRNSSLADSLPRSARSAASCLTSADLLASSAARSSSAALNLSRFASASECSADLALDSASARWTRMRSSALVSMASMAILRCSSRARPSLAR